MGNEANLSTPTVLHIVGVTAKRSQSTRKISGQTIFDDGRDKTIKETNRRESREGSAAWWLRYLIVLHTVHVF